MWHPLAVTRCVILSAIVLVASTAAGEDPKTSLPPKPAEASAGFSITGSVLDPSGAHRRAARCGCLPMGITTRRTRFASSARP